MPASLRSEGVRVHPGMPFAFTPELALSFAGIPSQAGSSRSAWGLDGPRYRSTHPAHRTVVGLAQQSRHGCGPAHELLGSLIPAEVESLSDAIIAVGDTGIPLEEFCDVGPYFEGFQSEGQVLVSQASRRAAMRSASERVRYGLGRPGDVTVSTVYTFAHAEVCLRPNSGRGGAREDRGR